MCPGKDYARAQVLVFIHNIVTKFKWEGVDPNEKISYNPSPIPAKGFPICLQPLENNLITSPLAPPGTSCSSSHLYPPCVVSTGPSPSPNFFPS